MAVNLLYFSATGNTARIVRTIAGQLGGISAEYDITLPEGREKEYTFEKGSLALIGIPVYAGRIPKLLLPVLHNINGAGARAVCMVTYGNREYEDALLELKDICEERGFTVIAAGAFVGEHSYTDRLAKGRPGIEDRKIAEDFAVRIRERMACPRTEELKVPGNFPYVEKPKNTAVYGPVTADSCTDCGLCESRCPTGAIDKKDYRRVSEEKCIHCCSCVKCCPVAAKSFPQQEFRKLTDWLETNFAVPDKQPELFF